MSITIKPEPLFLQLNRRNVDQIADDIFSTPYTVDYDGPYSLKIEFGNSGPITFYNSDGTLLLEEPVVITGPDEFVFKVKIDNTIVNGASVGSHSFNASIKTTEEIPAETALTYYEMEVIPSVANENFQTARINLPNDELYVIPEVILRELTVDDSGVGIKKVIWPEGGFKVEPAYSQDEGQLEVTPVRDENDHLKITLRNTVGPELDSVYIVTADATSKYVDISGRPVEVEIYLSSDEAIVGTADDPNNLKNINVPAGPDAVFTIDTPSSWL